MPQGASKKSLVVHPSWTEAQISLQDDAGVDNPIDAAVPRRELVNLESAAVSIENSSDVIIGPVTQFNVNGNIIIRHHENGWLGLEELGKKKKDEPEEETDGPESRKFDRKITNKTIRYTTWMSLALVLIVVPMVVIKLQHARATRPERLPMTSSSPPPACTLCNREYVTRRFWRGVPARYQKLQDEPVRMVVIKHTAGLFCMNLKECSSLTRIIQDYQLFQGAPDIWYNFLVGGDGRIYVGRGFGIENQFAHDTLDIAVHGNFTYDEFFPNMVEAATSLIELGVRAGHIAVDYKVVCHNQTVLGTLSPGRNVYKHVVSWDHYDNRTYF